MLRELSTVVVLLALSAAPSFAANRLYYEDFESDGWEERGAWSGNETSYPDTYFAGRVANNPHDGSYALRWNLMASRGQGGDPVLGSDFWCYSGPTAECRFGNVTGSTPDTLFVRYWGRLDAANWAGSSGTTGFYGKWGYFTEEVDGVLSLYTSPGSQANPAAHNWGCNVGSRMNPSWIMENWNGGASAAYASHAPSTVEPDGQWHKYEILVDYINNTIELWFDDSKVKNQYYSTGKFPIHPQWKMRGINFWHANGNKTDLSTDGPSGEYACGAQVDDIEAWDGLPSGDGGSGEDAPGVPGQPYVVQ